MNNIYRPKFSNSDRPDIREEVNRPKFSNSDRPDIREEVNEEEISGLLRIIRGDESAFDAALKFYKASSVEDSVRAVAEILNEKQSFAALATLLDIAMADGVLAGAEKDLLEFYVSAMDIPESAVSNIIEVIALKNDFSIFE